MKKEEENEELEESPEEPEEEKESSEEDDGLEEILIEEPDFNELRMQEIGFRAPVLSQMAEAPREGGIRLETGVESAPSTNRDNGGDPFSYRAESENGEERKYSSYSESIASPEQIDISTAGRERQSLSPQEIAFRPSEGQSRNGFSSGETYVQAERMDIESAGRKRKSGFDELGKVERKYEVK